MAQDSTIVSIPSDFDSSPIESIRNRNIERNARQLAALNIPKLDFVKEKKLPVFSKRVVKDYGRKDLPNRSAKTKAVSKGETPLRTHSRAGLWSCVSDCSSTFSSAASLTSHLKNDHHLPLVTENLAPLGLAICPFCQRVFEALRGISTHSSHCRARKIPVIELVAGDFPRQCFTWWSLESKWYEGIASKSEFVDCFLVDYPAKFYGRKAACEHEKFYNVAFSRPAIGAIETVQSAAFVAPIIAIDGGVLEQGFVASLSPMSVGSFSPLTPASPVASPKSLSFCATPALSVLTACDSVDLAAAPTQIIASLDASPLSNVLAACDCSDLVPSLGFPTCSPLASISSHVAIAESLPSTQLASSSSDGEDHKHVSQSPRAQRIDEQYARWNTPELLEVKEVPALLEINDCKFLGSDDEKKRLNDSVPDWFLKESVIPLNFIPTKENVTQVLIDIQRKAGFLKGFPPLAMWRASQKRQWERCTAEFAPYFEQALTFDRQSAEFLVLFLRIFELPAIALKFTLPEQKGVSEGKAALGGKLRKVESLTMQNRLHAASKVLFSHGIAPASAALFERLQSLHPALKEPIPDLTTDKKQFTIPPSKATAILFKKCTEHWDTPDPYGWNTAMLHLIRNAPGECFFSLFARLVSHVVSADVSDLVAYALASGSIIGLNKDDEETSLKRQAQGLAPRERPINQGSLVLKLAFDIALHSPKAQAAVKALDPIQKGVGAKRGMEIIAHTCNTLYAEGYAILKLDATNGFQEIKRSSLHRAVQKKCPSLLSLFKKYYTKESTCFFSMESEIRLLTANEGARIGCKLSSFAFALTVQDFYENIRARTLQARDGSCIKAATDDIVVVLKADAADEKALYSKVKEVLTVLHTDSQKVGLSFANDKAQFLLPKGWTPIPDLLPAGVSVFSTTSADPKLQGMEIVGAPVGSDAFCRLFVEKTLDRMLRESEALVKLHPQCATKLLKDCVCAAPAYLAQVCHPSISKQHLQKFDDHVWKLWLSILGGTENSGACCDKSMQRARMKAYLPSRLNGVGLRSWERTSDIAWFASVASCIGLQDVDFEYAIQFLKKQSESAYKLVVLAVGGPSYLEKARCELFPVNEPDVLCSPEFYVDLFKFEPKLKLQQEMLNCANHVAHQKFVAYVDHANTSEEIMIESMKREDSSLLSKMFTANLMQLDTRVTKDQFTSVARQFVCLPPITHGTGGMKEEKCSCSVQLCSNHKCKAPSAKLDAAGNHGLVCNPGVKAMRATILEKALEQSFRRTGGTPQRQPQTYDLLGKIFTKDDLARLFSGRLNTTESERRKKLAMEYLDIISTIPRGAIRTAELGMLRERFPAAPNAKDEENGKGVIRFDLKFPSKFPDKPQEVWLDHAIVQETCTTHAEDTLNYLLDNRVNTLGKSPAFQKTFGGKVRRYASLRDVVTRLMEERKLDCQPKFLCPIVSSLGYMNDDMTKLMKFMINCFKENFSKTPRLDGLDLKALKGRFKAELKNTLCFALVRANALSLCNQGVNGVTNPV